MKVTKDILDKLDNIAGNVAGKVYKGYSGRFMFGRCCYGISCGNATDCIEQASRLDIFGAKIDDLGKGFIVYWPHLEFDPAAQNEA